MRFVDAKGAIKIFYYLMSVDGKVKEDEVKKFEEIGNQVDQSFFDEYKNGLIQECQEQINKALDPEDYYDAIQEGIDNEIQEVYDLDFSLSPGYTNVSDRWLIWNMITIAYSDGEYSDVERKLIKFVVRKMDMEKVCFVEMEQLMKAAIAVEKELEWIKSTNKTYAEINEIVSELDIRKQTVLDSVKFLIEEE